MIKITQNGDPVLRNTAEKVPLNEIGTPKINKILKNLSEALETQKEGVAIAAPQIGLPLRIFIVSGKIFDLTSKDSEEVQTKIPNLVFINPVITKMSKDSETQEEGCLSVRGKYGTVNRASKTIVQAYDEKGNKFQRGGSGLLSKIFQHEIDHLDGILFLDKADEIYDTH